jgi:hypothetical protein
MRESKESETVSPWTRSPDARPDGVNGGLRQA